MCGPIHAGFQPPHAEVRLFSTPVWAGLRLLPAPPGDGERSNSRAESKQLQQPKQVLARLRQAVFVMARRLGAFLGCLQGLSALPGRGSEARGPKVWGLHGWDSGPANAAWNRPMSLGPNAMMTMTHG